MKEDQPAYIIHYYFKRLTKNAERLQKDFDEEAIHQFRVDVKKLRAFLRLIRSGTSEPDHLKFPRKFKKMYSLTGKIRDRQLCIKRIQEHDAGKNDRIPNKIAALQKELKDITVKQDNLLDKKQLFEIEEKLVAEMHGAPGDILIKDFFSQKLETINSILAKNDYRDKELHSIRKDIKDIIYVISIFRDDIKIPLPFSFWNKKEVKAAENLSHTLGLFNDACIALSFLIPADIKKDDHGEKDHLLAIRRKWLEEKRKLKKDIPAMLKSFRWSILS